MVFTLIEYSSQKQIQINASDIASFRIKEHPQGFGDYLNLVLSSGQEIVLCHAGIAFAPSFVSTGPLPDAPPVACMQDYYRLVDNLKSIVSDQTQRPAAILLINVLISILDGARAIGMDIGKEEEELEQFLSQLEKSI